MHGLFENNIALFILDSNLNIFLLSSKKTLILAKENKGGRSSWQYWTVYYSNSILRETSRVQALIFYQTKSHTNHPGKMRVQLINREISAKSLRPLVHLQLSESYYLGLTCNFHFHVPWKQMNASWTIFRFWTSIKNRSLTTIQNSYLCASYSVFCFGSVIFLWNINFSLDLWKNLAKTIITTTTNSSR